MVFVVSRLIFMNPKIGLWVLYCSCPIKCLRELISPSFKKCIFNEDGAFLLQESSIFWRYLVCVECFERCGISPSMGPPIGESDWI